MLLGISSFDFPTKTFIYIKAIFIILKQNEHFEIFAILFERSILKMLKPNINGLKWSSNNWILVPSCSGNMKMSEIYYFNIIPRNRYLQFLFRIKV